MQGSMRPWGGDVEGPKEAGSIGALQWVNMALPFICDMLNWLRVYFSYEGKPVF